ncbi:alanine racemase [Rothia sp. ZJ932]|uniref:alanine racemase n=1 Tax=Rothia sp. ZJ932 TaxID=2810516 RepID=UPI0019675190|nr:alanine racemase [Rothia sp. ZJ932]
MATSTPEFLPEVIAALRQGPERWVNINLDALTHNVKRLRELIGRNRTLIAVVKADAYGHGAVPVGRAALAAGADILGVVHIAEACALRNAGIEAPLMAWLHTPATDFGEALRQNIILGASGWDLDAIAYTASRTGLRARVHLKVDTGLGRNGATLEQWPELVQRAAAFERAGYISVEGIFTHLAVADEPARPETDAQLAAFEQLVQQAKDAGLTPELIHAANTPGTLTAHDKVESAQMLGNAVRVGLGLYGLSPLADKTSKDLGLRPVMTFETRVSTVKEVPAGQGVSYGLRYMTEKATTLALIPVGYADGVPRIATGAPVRIYPGGGALARTYPVVGRIAMDQIVVDLGQPGLTDPKHGYLGARTVLFGEGDNPPVEQWAQAASTINYEIITRISPRVARYYTTDSSAKTPESKRKSNS